ncbi:MAG: apolipoprotein N-acyltransferase [Alphaproteobacteria bacterium]|nr:MAG: apolipoprotein N-acyltransferase [Alphaproteobacteria bacterium]
MKPLLLLDRLAGYFILLWGWKRAAAAFLAGAASALAMAPFFAFPVLFATFPVLVWLIDSTTADPAGGLGARLRQGFAVGWTFGFGYFLAGLWWVGNAFLVEADTFGWMLPLAVAVLPALLALFWGAACALARLLWSDGWPRLLSLAAFLSLGEYLRGVLFTGFPWNAVGYGAMPAPIAMQSAAVLGLYGVTVLAVPLFCLAALRPVPERRRGAAAFAAIFLLAAAGHLGFGAWRLSTTPTATVDGVRLRLVQPAIDQSEKWSPPMEDRNFRLLLDLSLRGGTQSPGLDGVTHLVWPESAFSFVLTERPDALTALSRLIPDDAMLIAGALRVERAAAGGGQKVFNSVYVIDADGEIAGAADKVHLVPFGEYLPFQSWVEELGLRQLTGLPGGFAAGASRPLLDAGAAGRFLALICYEIIFPGVVDGGAGRPDFIVNLTNDAWFGISPGPFQHLHQAVVRGVEEGLPVVRVANSGVTSLTDPAGRTVARIGLGERATADAALPAPLAATPYVRLANTPFFLICGGFVLAGFAGAVSGRKGGH